jgi:Sigma-70, region 4
MRAVVQATVLDGLSTREASRLLGVHQGTVKTRLFRAKAVLRRELMEGSMTEAARSGPCHVNAESLRRWVDGTAGPLSGVSVEQHVLKCAQCRHRVAVLVPVEPLESVWDNVLRH